MGITVFTRVPVRCPPFNKSAERRKWVGPGENRFRRDRGKSGGRQIVVKAPRHTKTARLPVAFKEPRASALCPHPPPFAWFPLTVRCDTARNRSTWWPLIFSFLRKPQKLFLKKSQINSKVVIKCY